MPVGALGHGTAPWHSTALGTRHSPGARAGRWQPAQGGTRGKGCGVTRESGAGCPQPAAHFLGWRTLDFAR